MNDRLLVLCPGDSWFVAVPHTALSPIEDPHAGYRDHPNRRNVFERPSFTEGEYQQQKENR